VEGCWEKQFDSSVLRGLCRGTFKSLFDNEMVGKHQRGKEEGGVVRKKMKGLEVDNQSHVTADMCTPRGGGGGLRGGVYGTDWVDSR